MSYQCKLIDYVIYEWSLKTLKHEMGIERVLEESYCSHRQVRLRLNDFSCKKLNYS